MVRAMKGGNHQEHNASPFRQHVAQDILHSEAHVLKSIRFVFFESITGYLGHQATNITFFLGPPKSDTFTTPCFEHIMQLLER